MTKYTDQQILENRRKVIEYLKQPDLKKAVGILRNAATGGRCCLGHMCDALPEYVPHAVELDNHMYGQAFNTSVAPEELKDALGLNSSTGTAAAPNMINGHRSLSTWNDRTDVRPNEIGQFLEQVIMGGPGTPWSEIDVSN